MSPTSWTERTKPSATSYTERTKPTTTWSERAEDLLLQESGFELLTEDGLFFLELEGVALATSWVERVKP